MMKMGVTEDQPIIYGINDVESVVDYLLRQFSHCDVFTFTGPLGAGKTTLIQRLLRKSGVEGVITSPTFTYVNVYKNVRGQTFYHFDCYRIHSLDDFLEAGFGEYLYQPQSWSFIEWPTVIKPLLTTRVCQVTIDYHGDGQRSLSIVTIDN
ncbi:MAG TPA: tRNA (adenosine(37)-N6)-threonylcarbamoyltransferase complex ATPase subunit type 1 TsaE [Candidatus Babeliales bacterium]|nr:tRNA (adenosine(37)-N6)-threonylcarbamoyltransferase complex ATPase subunit type 1 TsaE [Candidatus Babeliales bacterium]